MNKEDSSWICPRCGVANALEAVRCASCRAMRTGLADKSGNRLLCRKCFYVFSGPPRCPICASTDCEPVNREPGK
jgi:rubrerythrin